MFDGPSHQHVACEVNKVTDGCDRRLVPGTAGVNGGLLRMSNDVFLLSDSVVRKLACLRAVQHVGSISAAGECSPNK